MTSSYLTLLWLVERKCWKYASNISISQKIKTNQLLSLNYFDEKISCVTSAKHLEHTLCNNVTDGFSVVKALLIDIVYASETLFFLLSQNILYLELYLQIEIVLCPPFTLQT